jgi:hypothetical protein
MSQPADNLEELRHVIAALNNLQIEYVLGGSMASSLLGVPRFTQDADLMVEPFQSRESLLAACFGPEYYVSVPAIIEANRHRRSFNVINVATGFKADLFVRKDRPFESSAMRRRIAVKLPDASDEPIQVLSAEDVILFKLEWYRLGGEISDRQWTDVLGLMRVQSARLDANYLKQWAAELGVSDLLLRATNEAATRP